MNHDFTDRLLDAGLKQYSRVAPPEDFAVRMPAARPARYAWFGWLAVPAAATLLATLAMPPLPQAPVVFAIAHHAPAVSPVSRAPRPKPLPYKPPFHTLTPQELAAMDLSAAAQPSADAAPIVDLEIKPLVITPLEGEGKQ